MAWVVPMPTGLSLGQPTAGVVAGVAGQEAVAGWVLRVAGVVARQEAGQDEAAALSSSMVGLSRASTRQAALQQPQPMEDPLPQVQGVVACPDQAPAASRKAGPGSSSSRMALLAAAAQETDGVAAAATPRVTAATAAAAAAAAAAVAAAVAEAAMQVLL